MLTFRLATAADAIPIAHLHARSWQIHYRGMLSDDYLDNLVIQDREAIWTERFKEMPQSRHLLLAHQGDQLIGFVCTFLNKDEQYGALLDNLHVTDEVRGQGIGKQLLIKTAQWVYAQDTDSSMYLWVLKDNKSAIHFYEKMGGEQGNTKLCDLQGAAKVSAFRYVWTDLSLFLPLV